MLILSKKNNRFKKKSPQQISGLGPLKGTKRSSGFTLIEALLAIGILSVVAVQLIAVQGTTLVVAQSTFRNVTATWTLRSAMAQVEYVFDALGEEGFTPEATFVPSSAPEMKVTLVKKEADLEPSKLILSVMKLGKAFNGGGADEEKESEESSEDPAGGGGFKEMASLLDSQIPKDLFKTVQVEVTWPDGNSGTKSIDAGILLIKPHAFQVPNIPGGL